MCILDQPEVSAAGRFVLRDEERVPIRVAELDALLPVPKLVAAVAVYECARRRVWNDDRAASMASVQICHNDLVRWRRVDRAVSCLLQLHQIDVAPALVYRVATSSRQN